jgi:single stranded DNA-binding protein
MRSVNKVILIGNATRDAELRTTTSGKPVASIRLATNRNVTTAAGERREERRRRELDEERRRGAEDGAGVLVDEDREADEQEPVAGV